MNEGIFREQLLEWSWKGKAQVHWMNLVPLPLGPPQIPHELVQDLTQTCAMSGRHLTACIMAPTIRSRLARFHMLSIYYCSHSVRYNWLYTYKTYAG